MEIGWYGKRVCCFDLDGTLVDSMGAFADLAARLLHSRYGMLEIEARRAYLRTSGLPFFQQLEALFPGREENGDLARCFEEEKLAGFFQEGLFPEVPETVSCLQHHGIKVAVSSNNAWENVTEFLSRRSVGFDYTLGYQPGFEKGRDHFEYLMEREGCSPKELVFVGDSLHDGERARECGVDFVGRTGTFTREEFSQRFPGNPVVDSLGQLIPLLIPHVSTQQPQSRPR